MSEQVTVDSLEFARSGKVLRGKFEIAALDRLHDRLASTGGTIAYELTGYMDDRGKPCLHCQVRGLLQLVCQRCLQPLAWQAEIATDLVLALSEGELAEDEDAPEAPDRLLAQKDMRVQDLVEDELLLGMPLAPRHSEAQCQPSVSPASGDTAGDRAAKPFAALAKLKPGRH